MRKEVPFKANFALFSLTFTGLLLTALIFADAEWFHVVLQPDAPHPQPLGASTDSLQESGPLSPSDLERLKKSILNVRVDRCDGQGQDLGTGFVVRSGYIATAAHILEGQQACNARIQLVDFKGIAHVAQLDGLSSSSDLALLRIADTALPPLELTDSTLYEDANRVVRVMTIGYPLEGLASSADRAAISGQGNVSQYDQSRNAFITSGLNLNPGNSGGPIFVVDNWKVLGVAVAKLDATVGEGIALVTPSKTLEQFFREKTGQELR